MVLRFEICALRLFIKYLPVIIFFNALVIFFIYSAEVEREFGIPVKSEGGRVLSSNPIKSVMKLVKSSLPTDGLEDIRYQSVENGRLIVPILYYHHVGFVKDSKDEFRQLITVSPSNFKEQMRYLKDAGFEVISLKDLLLGFEGKKKLSEKSVILTFDDGYRDYYDYAFPILLEFNLSSINFIILNSLDMDDNLTIPQVREMLNSGLFEVGAHGVSHAKLTGMALDKMEREVVDSKAALERKLKTNIDFFAYPGGFLNDQVEDAVNKAHYLGSVSTLGGINHTVGERYRLKRVKVGNWDGNGLKSRLESLGFAF